MSNISSQFPSQFPLPLSQIRDYKLSQFVVGNNLELMQALDSKEERLLLIYSEQALGKTHLLQGLFNQYLDNERSAYYLPMESFSNYAPDMLMGLEQLELLCLDNVHAIAGNREWEQALFHLFNRFRETDNKLVFSATTNAQHMGFELPDLKTRLQWGLTYQLEELDDEQKIAALIARAQELQFDLPYEVANFLMKRSSRDMATLVSSFERLDLASLAAQRKLTIPFVKQILNC